MVAIDSRAKGAKERLLFRHPTVFDTFDDFDQYLKDIASVTTISPELIQDARAAFLKNLQQKRRNRTIFAEPCTSITQKRQRAGVSPASFKYWLFDAIIVIAIAYGLRNMRQDPSRNEPANVPALTSGDFPPITQPLFKVNDVVEVFDESIHHSYAVPFEIKKILSNKDGSISYDLQRRMAGRDSLLVLKNIQAKAVRPSKPFESNTNAICEFDLEIYPCTVLSLYEPRLPGGGLYSVSFRTKDGFVMNTYRPYWNIWRIVKEDSPDSSSFLYITNPLANR